MLVSDLPGTMNVAGMLVPVEQRVDPREPGANVVVAA